MPFAPVQVHFLNAWLRLDRAKSRIFSNRLGAPGGLLEWFEIQPTPLGESRSDLRWVIRAGSDPFDFSKTVNRLGDRLPGTETGMKSAAFGIRMHSGWGILIAVGEGMDVIDRRRIVVITDQGRRGNQPFHHASELGLLEAEKYLSHYRAESEHLASEVIGTAVRQVNWLGYSVATAALLEASARPLPALPQILASHPLIHTAEGELFREVVSTACKSLRIPVTRYRERSLEEAAKAALGASALTATLGFNTAGKKLGPPWTADHKAAALAAYLALKEIGAKKATVSSRGS